MAETKQAKTVKKSAPAPKVAKAAPATTSAAPLTAAQLRASGDPKLAGIRLHGKEFTGVVTSDKAHKTVTVQWVRRRLIKKFERYEKRFSRVYAHNPESIDARTGDTVRVVETRPLSKTKNFVVVEIVSRAEVAK
jgi:small subunit ribosomal protein S17